MKGDLTALCTTGSSDLPLNFRLAAFLQLELKVDTR